MTIDCSFNLVFHLTSQQIVKLIISVTLQTSDNPSQYIEHSVICWYLNYTDTNKLPQNTNELPHRVIVT